MDAIHIRGLEIPCRIGVSARERRRPQPVVVSLVLRGDWRAAARRDCLAAAVDYLALRDRVVDLVRTSRCRLLETLAERVAAAGLADRRVRAAEVTVEKPAALGGRGRVAVYIRRGQPRRP